MIRSSRLAGVGDSIMEPGGSQLVDPAAVRYPAARPHRRGGGHAATWGSAGWEAGRGELDQSRQQSRSAVVAYPSGRVARRSAASVTAPAPRLPVPGYLPAIAHPVLPWTRRRVQLLAGRSGARVDDLWDEAVAALIRAAVHYDPTTGYAFSTYACRSVLRACDRYVLRGQRARPVVSLEDAGDSQELTAPSAEAEAMARDALRWTLLLREHAALASSRGDCDTTPRLLEAASAADRVARRPRRHSSPIVEDGLTMNRSSRLPFGCGREA
jgi:hypothetical protein